jgi:hypothetical protein
VWVGDDQRPARFGDRGGTIEALRAKLPGMIFDLLEEAGVSDMPASIEIIARASDRLTAAE